MKLYKQLLLSLILSLLFSVSTLTATPRPTVAVEVMNAQSSTIQAEQFFSSRKKIHPATEQRKFKKDNLRSRLRKKFSKVYIHPILKNVQRFSGCQTVTLKNGEQMEVEIISMDDYTISYTRCNKKDSAELSVSLKDVDTIITHEGDLLFHGLYNTSDRKSRIYGIVAVSSASISLIPGFGILFGPLAIIFGALALKEINNNPEANIHRNLAMGGLVGGIVVSLATGMFLLLFFGF